MVKPVDTYMVMGLCWSFVTPGVLEFFYVTLLWFPPHCTSLRYGNHVLFRSLGALQFKL